jgi:hypothetical protein
MMVFPPTFAAHSPMWTVNLTNRSSSAMAKRFRHEGLPVARLWENHSAFISVGLNGKGRPGIWLVQKTH